MEACYFVNNGLGVVGEHTTVEIVARIFDFDDWNSRDPKGFFSETGCGRNL